MPDIRLRLAVLPAVLAVLPAVLAVLAACAAPTTPAPPQLRIVNGGGADITGLVVLFPGATADSPARRTPFGDVAAGAASAYQAVPDGVYRYAAYEYQLNGKTVEQPVIDWLGESPMDGARFTYRLELDLTQPPGGQMKLAGVTVDAP